MASLLFEIDSPAPAPTARLAPTPLAGVVRKYRPPFKGGRCKRCNRQTQKSIHEFCASCTMVQNAKRALETYANSRMDRTQRELYQPISDEECEALATCDTDGKSQVIVDAVIVRETARIRERWDDAEHYKRAHLVQEQWDPSNYPLKT